MQQQTKLDYEFTATRTALGDKIRFNFRRFKRIVLHSFSPPTPSKYPNKVAFGKEIIPPFDAHN